MMRQPETRQIRFIALATTVLVASLLAAVTLPSAQAGSPAPESARHAGGPLADDTALPPATSVPTAAPTRVNYRVCPYLMTRVPATRINHSLANANNTYGWNLRCSPNQPPGPFNPIRSWLGLRDRGRPWHALFNDVQWKCGCG